MLYPGEGKYRDFLFQSELVRNVLHGICQVTCIELNFSHLVFFYQDHQQLLRLSTTVEYISKPETVYLCKFSC